MIRSIPGTGPKPIPIIPPNYRHQATDSGALWSKLHVLLIACRLITKLRLEEQNGTGFVDYCGILRRIRRGTRLDCDANKTEV